jgi:hypothetical protein
VFCDDNEAKLYILPQGERWSEDYGRGEHYADWIDWTIQSSEFEDVSAVEDAKEDVEDAFE